MRKVMYLGLVLIFLVYASSFVMIGCGDDDDDDPTPTPTPTATATPTATPPPAAEFFDDFDSYEAGSYIAGQGGWETWNGSEPDTMVTDAMSYSAPNSLGMLVGSDIVHQFRDITSGQWYAKVQVYIPSDQTGDLLFIMLNQYSPNGAQNWSLQVKMSTQTGLAESLGGTANEEDLGSLPLITDQWVEIYVEIDLDSNYYVVYYNGVVLDQRMWSMSGLNEIQAFDLFSDDSSMTYFDDIYLDTNP